MKMKASRMFSFITRTWNPLGGKCDHRCRYCWARRLANQYLFVKYNGEPRLYEKEFRYKFAKEDFVFVCDMSDLFGDWVPKELIQRVVDFANKSEAQFLFLTKNPKRYKEFAFGNNCTLGATIETDFDKLCLDGAPPRSERLREMALLKHPHKMVSVEPIMKFSGNFLKELLTIKLDFAAVGFDNYHNNLPEPPEVEAEMLASALEKAGIKVYRKTMRIGGESMPER